MATLKETLDRILGPSKGAALGPSGNAGFISQSKSPSPYGIERVAPRPHIGPTQEQLIAERAAKQHADFVAQWDAEKAAREGTETLAQFEARTGKKYTRSPYGIRASSRFF